MPAGKHDQYSPQARGLSRRAFIKLSATAGLLAGCGALPASATPTAPPSTATATGTSTASSTPPLAPTATPTAPPTATTAPSPTVVASPTRAPVAATTTTAPPSASATAAPTATATATTTPTPTIALGRVAHVSHSGVWDGGQLSPDRLREILDASLSTLTNTNDADAAWASLFAPHERVAIKVNTIGSSSYSTHLALVLAVAERLQVTGIPAEQIILFDRSTRELEASGYPINRDGAGLRCYGTDGQYTAGWTLMGDAVSLSDILLGCDALINIPILKNHGIAGISFAMKNHYGTFDQPGRFHQPRMGRALAELNALEPIAQRTRLIIGDALHIVSANWRVAESGDSLLLSFDPVAHDTVGLHLYNQRMLPGQELSQTPTFARASVWLENGAALGLGLYDIDKIELLEDTLG